ncbi:hypothetical protein A3L09_03615 [Thermococcus profundus]|uniref:DUF3213 domain-containing protein n=1 Tax=Thermococcus profundus TaxID=49899 RepID=A0A2Z2MCI2_THEPR|nr:DUF3213 domain-containing protein [Thermococcus profundus]ASJ02402.1 hypothetical protein A3L09_03615 [Thermococcus profundus]
MSETVLKKNLVRLDLKFGKINPESAQIKQYELEKDTRIWRVFLNGYSKNGFVIFDEEQMDKDQLTELLKDLEPEIKSLKRLTVAELVEESMSWNNVFSHS